MRAFKTFNIFNYSSTGLMSDGIFNTRNCFSVGGVVSNILYVHPEPWGFMIQFDGCILFKGVGSTTNQLAGQYRSSNKIRKVLRESARET